MIKEGKKRPQEGRLQLCLHVYFLFHQLVVHLFRQYQVGNTSYREITEVKQLEPRVALGWVNQELKWMLERNIQ